MNLRPTWDLLVAAARAWSSDRATRLGAALAYYGLFALAPFLALVVSLPSLFFGEEQVTSEIYDTIAEFIDADVADLVVTMIDKTRAESAATYLPIISVGVLLFSATLLFAAWREIVDIIWDIPKERGLRNVVRIRAIGLLAIVGSGVLLTVIMIVETLITSASNWLDIDLLGPLWTVVSEVLPVAGGGVFLAVVFKYSPVPAVAWRSVWLASIVTMILLSIGARAYGIYLNTVGLSSAAGVAGTIILGLLVLYYAAQILLYGMEIVKLKHLGASDPAAASAPGTGAS